MKRALTIAVDAMGGDKAPAVVINGIGHIVETHPDIRFMLFGRESDLTRLVAAVPEVKTRVQIVNTDGVVAMDTKPSQALRQREGTSLWHAIEAVKLGDADAAISAGNTGALMAMSRYCLGMLPGISRPAISAVWPTVSGRTIVLDVGANVEVGTEQMVEFAIMGNAYARVLLEKDRPTVGLLNIGSEDSKGHEEIRFSAALLKDNKIGLNFIGFVEGNDIALGKADVIVTDGFTGNVALKTAEGTAKMLAQEIRQAFGRSLVTKLGALIAQGAFAYLRRRMDPEAHNGAPLLGLNGLVIKSHGGTDGPGFARALEQAIELSGSDFANKIVSNIANLGEHSGPPRQVQAEQNNNVNGKGLTL